MPSHVNPGTTGFSSRGPLHAGALGTTQGTEMMLIIRRLQAENDRLLDHAVRLERDNAFAEQKLQALESHHAAVTEQEARVQHSAIKRMERMRNERDGVLAEKDRVDAALLRAASERRPPPLSVALSHAIRQHPDLFAPEVYRRDAEAARQQHQWQQPQRGDRR